MNLLITGAWNAAKNYIEEIEKLGHVVQFMQYEKDELPCSYDWVEGVICNSLFLYHPIERFVNLNYIQLTSVGYDRVPMDYIEERNIEIHNAKGVYSVPMAEYAIAGVLQLYKQMRFFVENQKKHRWEKHRGLIELFGKRVCIIGCGSVGTECAKRFQAFGCNVIGVARHVKKDEHFHVIVSWNELENELAKADIIVLAVPGTDETKHLMNEKRCALLKEGAILVNVARGALVDTQALIKVLDRLCGAVLDVFEEEPLEESSALWEMENVIVSPHNSFVGDGNAIRIEDIIWKNLEYKI